MLRTVLWGFLFQYSLLINAFGLNSVHKVDDPSQIKDSLNGTSFDETKEIGVLPKFEVQIDTAKDVVSDDNLIKATIRAKYPDGKPVKGNTTFFLEAVYGDFEWILPKQQKTIDLDGEVYVEFSPLLDRFAIRSQLFLSPLKMSVIVTEQLTGNQQNASTTVYLNRNPYKLQRVNWRPHAFKPNTIYVVQVAVQNVDGSPVVDSMKKVELSLFEVSFVFRPHIETGIKYEEPLNENGIATFQVTLPSKASTYYRFYASYDGVKEHIETIKTLP